jgi:hypothetical protein
MASRSWFFLTALLAAGRALGNGQELIDTNKEVCKGRVESSRQCRWIHGTVAIYNGTPAIRIRQQRSKNIYAVGPSEEELMPAELKLRLTIDNAIEAQFKICPIDKMKKKGLPVVCIDEVKIRNIIDNP